jgi:hypothetical protein
MLSPWLWLVGQLGILIEILGAGYLFWKALEAQHSVGSSSTNQAGVWFDAAKRTPLRALAEQRIGFGLLILGLVLQLIGGWDGA